MNLVNGFSRVAEVDAGKIAHVELPPFDCLQPCDGFVIETHSDLVCRKAGDDGIGLDVLVDEGSGTDDGTIANADPATHYHICSDPDIVADGDPFRRAGVRVFSRPLDGPVHRVVFRGVELEATCKKNSRRCAQPRRRVLCLSKNDVWPYARVTAYFSHVAVGSGAQIGVTPDLHVAVKVKQGIVDLGWWLEPDRDNLLGKKSQPFLDPQPGFAQALEGQEGFFGGGLRTCHDLSWSV